MTDEQKAQELANREPFYVGAAGSLRSNVATAILAGIRWARADERRRIADYLTGDEHDRAASR